MSNDIEAHGPDESVISDGTIRWLVVSLTTLVVFLVAAFVFACMHPILFAFPAIVLVGWIGLEVLAEILGRL